MKTSFTILLLFAVLNISIFAQNESNFTNFTIDETGTITAYTGMDTSVVIPEIVSGIQVTDIGDYVFGKKGLTSITMPNTITSIGNWAFAENQLTSVTIPPNVTYLGYSAFDHNKLASVIIPNSVTEIGVHTFSNNQITSVTIPGSVTTIGDNAFYRNRLSSVIIPNSVTSISEYAFSENRLTRVTIGSNVTLATRNYSSIAFNFDNLYATNGRKAGTYVLNNGKWTKEDLN